MSRHRLKCCTLAPLLAKIEVDTAWPTPTSVMEVRQFCRLNTFFRKFMVGPSIRTTELTKKKVSWFWAVDSDKACKELNPKLTAAPVLAAPDPAAPF